MVEQPPLLDPVVEGQSEDGEEQHLRKDCGVEAAVHDALAEQLVLHLELEVILLEGLIGLQLREEAVLS